MTTVNLHHIGEEIDSFFTPDVLGSFLKAPLRHYTKTFQTTYQVFSKRLNGVIKRKEAFITGLKEEFIANILFKSESLNVFLAFVHLQGKTAHQQEIEIYNVIREYFHIDESEYALSEEPLPDLVKDIIDDITLKHVDRSNFRLLKVKRDGVEKTIVFHGLAVMIDPNNSKAISVVSGFEF